MGAEIVMGGPALGPARLEWRLGAAPRPIGAWSSAERVGERLDRRPAQLVPE